MILNQTMRSINRIKTRTRTSAIPKPQLCRRTVSEKKKKDERNELEKIEKYGAEINQIINELQTVHGVDDPIEGKPVDQTAKDITKGWRDFFNGVREDLSNVPTNASMYELSESEAPENVRKTLAQYPFEVNKVSKKIIETYGDDIEAGLARVDAVFRQIRTDRSDVPVRVAVSGASGAIGYALVFRIASGAMFGPNVPVELHLLELPQAMNALKGVVMELQDCAFSLVKNIHVFTSADEAFQGADYVLLVGASPRTKGMERGDLLLKNAEIFSQQGKSLNRVAKNSTRVIVVGNPANTNALIAQRNCNLIPPENFSAMTRLDHNRGLGLLSEKVNCKISDIERFVIWGNHSATQFPDVTHARINQKWANDIVDQKWLESTFIPNVQQRGAAIISARGASSAASAANALVDHVYDLHYGTYSGWTSMAVHSKGEYGVESGLFYSYPVVINDKGDWAIVKNLPLTQWAAEKMEATHKELQQERDGVSKFLP